ncbi:hypothetical protein IFR05_002426 [Cadophora sp. M221]|nr:hypothetical protein IFR05_002426 [Cadophora sp. M221]
MPGEAVAGEVEFNDEEHDGGSSDARVLNEMIVTGTVDSGVSPEPHDRGCLDRGTPSQGVNGNHCGTNLKLEGAFGCHDLTGKDKRKNHNAFEKQLVEHWDRLHERKHARMEHPEMGFHASLDIQDLERKKASRKDKPHEVEDRVVMCKHNNTGTEPVALSNAGTGPIKVDVDKDRPLRNAEMKASKDLKKDSKKSSRLKTADGVPLPPIDKITQSMLTTQPIILLVVNTPQLISQVSTFFSNPREQRTCNRSNGTPAFSLRPFDIGGHPLADSCRIG